MDALRTLLLNRITVLLVPLITGFLVTHFGVDGSVAGSWAQRGIVAAIAVAGFAISFALQHVHLSAKQQQIADSITSLIRQGATVGQAAWQTTGSVPDATSKAAQSVRPVNLSPVLFLFLPCLWLAGGCQASTPFRLVVTKEGPSIVSAAQRYVSAEPDASVKAAEQVQLDKLAAATAAGTSVSEVDAAWQPVKAWYIRYVDGDAKLDPIEQLVRHDLAAHFDQLIADEHKRPLSNLAQP